ncbi:MAG: pyruvate kinase [Candidatus Paceibacterota bacterium]|jgi:pyruvate kinase
MELRKKTKIVATIGPATEKTEILTNLIEAGLDVARFNFSHGSHEEHQVRLEAVKAAASKTRKTIAVIQDLSGPKIRIGDFSTEHVQLVSGEPFTLTTEQITGDTTRAYVNYPLLPKEVKVGGQILLDDGKKRLEVTSIKGKEVHCKVIVGGEIKGRRGVNLPGANLSISALTEKDKEDLQFGLNNKVTYFALSFVRHADDIAELRAILDVAGSDAGIIAKIETPEAVDNIDAIIALSDGVMVARGDLAIEVPAEMVPMIQKMIIRKCNDAGKPVITATQMLESMINSPVPTRAEVSDIANAIIDGTDAVMLSEETALGKYPAEAVRVMSRVALQIEQNYPERDLQYKSDNTEIPDAITSSAVKLAHDINAELIVALTESGFTARMISRFKPNRLIVAMTPNEHASEKVMLSFGCYPLIIPRFKTIDEAFDLVRSHCLKHGICEIGGKVVIAAGAPFDTKGTPTNMLIVKEI